MLALYLLLVIPYRVAFNHRNTWKKVVIERDPLIEKAKPKLNVVKKTVSIRGQHSEWCYGLEVHNSGKDDTMLSQYIW